MKKNKRISIIGLGYIGLPTAAVFAQCGCKVIGVDSNPQVVETLNQGKIHIHEPQLAEAVQQAVSSGRFFATTQPQSADAFIIAVPTPFQADHQPDLSYIRSAIERIAPVLAAGNLIVLESTSPVGTTEKLAEWLTVLRPDLTDQLFFAYCPERVLPGKIMQEIYHNDRIIGGLNPESSEQSVSLYQLFAKGECLTTDSRTAEMCKLTENAFRDVNIAFANELSMICDRHQINVWELIALANRHPRVNILQAGAGVGGHCIAVDPWFIVSLDPQQSCLIQTARHINDHKPQWLRDKIKLAVADCASATDRKPSDITIACFGLAFKADVDDLRHSPALQITEQLADWHQGTLLAVEPYITALPESLNGKATLTDFHTALQQADIAVLLVDHQLFKTAQPPQRWIVDAKGIWQ
ncbi:UDP-N-acetyl-D-mannosaminuronic acid dehydrogenase [Pasteurellaceae bacterium Orientalotternb1]|nr:UDP-N-acetyl-D-mannosaminuronic acid dehydrogenase [Pasteurellaceae bacterium Orientalotternb1]